MRVPSASRVRMLPLSLALGFLAIAQPREAASQVSINDLQVTILTFATLVGSDSLLAQLGALTPQEWQALYNVVPDKEKLVAAVQAMQARAGLAPGSGPRSLLSVRPTFSSTEFTPRYPSGSGYDAYTATLPGLGLLSDGDLPGFQDDRCDTSAEGNAKIVYDTFQVAAIVADVACDTIVVFAGEGTNLPACVAKGEAHALALAAQIAIDQCDYQTGAVDSAEIEAGYENTRRIIGTVNNIDAQLHDFIAQMRVELQVLALQTLGCGQGFWKTHAAQWTGGGAADLSPTYEPTTLFDSVFGAGAATAAGLSSTITLLGVLQSGGGGATAQARNAVTLLLNNDAVNNSRALPCDDAVVEDVGNFAQILGPFRRRFLLSSAEAGEPVDVELVHVTASILNPTALTFTDVTAATTSTAVKTGVQLLTIDLPDALKNARGFEIDVKHDHHMKSLPIFGAPEGVEIVHFGTTLFHQTHERNVGMGQ